jgi:serine/threonine-protein kinase
MGEVYRATDTFLKRAVAIKVLPDGLATDAERLARFQREAEVLASLNHPNIAQIHGLEKQDGTIALVMELVEGPTLADRIVQGPLAFDEALTLARQIADALEAAHEQGIIHRDLKPANVKVRPDGTAKVLDFGLAKALAPPAASAGTAHHLSHSPTITSPAMTQAGLVLGTAAYMSPEQARGKAVDRRADIWALGCVLYEMLTGTRAFGGDDVTDTLAFVITKEPDWTKLPDTTPASIRRLLRRAIAKDPRQRLSDVTAIRLDIDEALAASADGPTANDARKAATWQRTASIAAAASLVVGLGAGAVTWWATRPEPLRPTRLSIPAASMSITNNGRDLAITKDGSRVVYVSNNGTQLLVRAMDQIAPTTLAGLGSPSAPFFSPDGQSIGFVDLGFDLRRVAVSGGPAVPICRLDGSGRGATWGPDGTIVFATQAILTGLQQVSASGGEPTTLTKPEAARGEADHYWPEFLPGGRAVLFTIVSTTGPGNDQVAVLDLQSGRQKILTRGTGAQYVPSGHLVYVAAGTLLAVAFDLERLEIQGTPVPVESQILTTSAGAATFDVASNGTLVYVSGARTFNERRLVWVDRGGGREETLDERPRAYIYPRLSPDRDKVALAILDQDRDIWVLDLRRRNLTRLTTHPGDDRYPVWTPDGQRLVWDSTRAGAYNLYWQSADGVGAVERLTDSPITQASHTFTPDGKRLVMREDRPGTLQDLVVLELDGERRVTPLLNSPFNERNAELSFDSKWIAYESDESGQFEVYVRSFPDVDRMKSPVSTGGGRQPLWSADGRELFYRDSRGAVVGVTVKAVGNTLEAGASTTLVPEGYYSGGGGTFGRTYDVSADGKRFLMIKEASDAKEADAPTPTITVVQNWTEELKRLVPKN